MAQDVTTGRSRKRAFDTEALAPGEVFAGHEILEEAGRGGMGVVYAARHQRLGVTRALKVLPASAARTPTFRLRFERESQLAASLDHPNIVPIYEAGECYGHLYLSMRFVAGPNLRELLASEHSLAIERAVRLVTQLAAALDAAHQGGLVHRDVKPANVLLEDGVESDRLFLGDFGISRLLTDAGELTRTGEMVGTVSYVAPEQIAGEAVDGRADVYSLACVAYEALTGNPPFDGPTPLATMFAHANAPRPSASTKRSELPGAIDRVFACALSIEPRARHAHASEFAADLARALRGGARARVRIPAALASRRIVALLACVLAAAALGVGVIVVGDESTVEPAPRSDRAPLTASAAPAVGSADVLPGSEAIAVGHLNVWVASPSRGAIAAIVPATGPQSAPPIRLGGAPVSVVAAFGSVWVVDRDSQSLIRLNPGEGTDPVWIPVGSGPSDVAVTSTHLWVTNEGDGTVSRIDPETDRVDATTATGRRPSAVAVGEGGVWIANSADGTITEVNPITARQRGVPISVGGTPTAIAAGEAGVWVIDASGRRIVRVGPGSRDISDPIDAGARPMALTTGFGYVWVASADGFVTRIDPTLLRPVDPPTAVGEDPRGITVGKGFVWTVNGADSTVARIQPRAD